MMKVQEKSAVGGIFQREWAIRARVCVMYMCVTVYVCVSVVVVRWCWYSKT